ncbi:MAG: hypothetical protein GY804_09205 [Alphaproteobacteria bacterium]|nr:hypothetical protein [Alphaproteobacteria bacterium]
MKKTAIKDMKRLFLSLIRTPNQSDVDMISVGLVADTGETFYAECNDYDPSRLSDQVKSKILSNLSFESPKPGESEYFSWGKNGNSVELRESTSVIHTYIADWFQELLGGPLSWVDYTNGGINPSIAPELITTPEIVIVAYSKQAEVFFDNLWGDIFNIPQCVYSNQINLRHLLLINDIDPTINLEDFAGMSFVESNHVPNALWHAKIIKACYAKLNQN